MNKTIYIRDEDMTVWDRAKEFAGDKLAPVIVDRLKEYIAHKEAEVSGFERLEVRYRDSEDNDLPKRKAFYGKWIFSIKEPYEFRGEDGEFVEENALAITAKGNVCVYRRICGGEFRHVDETFRVFSSLEAATKDADTKQVALAAIEKIGVSVEELDI